MLLQHNLFQPPLHTHTHTGYNTVFSIHQDVPLAQIFCYLGQINGILNILNFLNCSHNRIKEKSKNGCTVVTLFIEVEVWTVTILSQFTSVHLTHFYNFNKCISNDHDKIGFRIYTPNYGL